MTGGGSFPCNTDAIFNVFDNLLIFAMTLLFRFTYAHPEQSLVPRPRGFLTHEDRALLLIFSQIRIPFSVPTEFMVLPLPGVFVAVLCNGTLEKGSLFRIQDPSNYSVVVVF